MFPDGGFRTSHMIEHLFEAVADVMFVVDLAGLIAMANPAASTITGFARGELVGRPIAQLLADEHSGVHTMVRRRVEAGAILRREDSWLIARTERIPVSVSAAPIVDGTGAVTGIVLVVRDVRELRAAEAELRTAMTSIEQGLERARSQLQLAERRATLGTLAAGVGHELRNIAQIHLGALDTIRTELEQLGDTESLRMALAELDGVGEHITTHARRLVQLAKPGPDHVRPLNVNRAIEEVVAMLQGAGKLRRIEVVTVVDDVPVMVTVNKTRIEQILVNLVVNAADAIGDGRGRILLAVHPDLVRRRVTIEVTDTGPGIPREVLPRIFEPFFTTKPDDAGTGLGLPVAKEIVESYGGTLAITSTVGVGTTCSFDLPMS